MSALAAHDFELEPNTGHDELWSFVLDRLAAAWSKAPVLLTRRLNLSYTGLPRGRVTRPEKHYFILQGNDAPLRDWESPIIDSVRLSGTGTKSRFDEHETQIIGHPEAFASVFGRVQLKSSIISKLIDFISLNPMHSPDAYRQGGESTPWSISMSPGKVSDGDRRARQAGRLARVLRVLEMIQGRGRYGVKDIATVLECSQRTVFRDLAVLELAGVSYSYDRESKSLQVRPGFHFPTLNLTDDEIIGQATATAVTSSPGLDVTEGAEPTTRKLGVTSKENSAKLLAEVGRLTSALDLKLADHSKHHAMIRTVQWALIQGKRLTGTYSSPYESKSKSVDLHPFRLCLVQQAWYLIGRPDGSQHPQTYRIARFKTIRPLDAPSVVPADFDLMAYFGNAWGVYRGAQSYDVEIRFSREAAYLVTETLWHSTQTAQRHKDGTVSLSFRVAGLNEIVHWLLGWSCRAKVIQPPELRDLVLEHLRRALVLNGDDFVLPYPGFHTS